MSSGSKGTRQKVVAAKASSETGVNFTLPEIRSLLEMLEAHEVTEFRLSRGGERLALRRGEQKPLNHDVPQAVSYHPVVASHPHVSAPPVQAPAPASKQAEAPAAAPAEVRPAAPAPAAPAPASSSKIKEIVSPMVGTFYRRPAVDAEPYVEVGDSVKKGAVLCIVEAMKLMNEIESDATGVIKEICLEDGTMVEYGEVLFRIEVS